MLYREWGRTEVDAHRETEEANTPPNPDNLA
jgi:hypothetical protein